jgi:hypothetical protein
MTDDIQAIREARSLLTEAYQALNGLPMRNSLTQEMLDCCAALNRGAEAPSADGNACRTAYFWANDADRIAGIGVARDRRPLRRGGERMKTNRQAELKDAMRLVEEIKLNV